MQLQKLKNYLKIDHDFDDDILLMLLEVAISYLDDAIDKEVLFEAKLNVKYDYATTLLVGHWYEQRIATSDSALNEIPFGVSSMIEQLRYANA